MKEVLNSTYTDSSNYFSFTNSLFYSVGISAYWALRKQISPKCFIVIETSTENGRTSKWIHSSDKPRV